MKKLYAPWREDYTVSVAHSNNPDTSPEACVFCNHFNDTNDENNLILKRFNHMVVMLNRYPYNAGHILILPHAHVGCLHELPQEARIELMELTTHSVEIVKKILKCDGINVGLNLGKAAGAGIPSHLHMHILPRFIGDTNFLPTIADTKAISFDLIKIYKNLKPEFDSLR